MEIQTFFLAMQLQKQGPGDFTAVTPCVSSFTPPDGVFPFNVRLPYLLLLRRPSVEAGDEITLRFNLIDEDGRQVGSPSNVEAAGRFPGGHRNLLLAGQIAFTFPAAGDYRLDITADGDQLHGYNLEIGARPAE